MSLVIPPADNERYQPRPVMRCGLVLMNYTNRSGKRLETPLTCRDKGQTWGKAGAWCLSWWPCDASGLREAYGSHPNGDRHQAPSSTQPFPLSLQEARRRDVIRCGRQHSSGRRAPIADCACPCSSSAMGTICLPPRQDGSVPTGAAPPVCSILGNLLMCIIGPLRPTLNHPKDGGPGRGQR